MTTWRKFGSRNRETLVLLLSVCILAPLLLWINTSFVHSKPLSIISFLALVLSVVFCTYNRLRYLELAPALCFIVLIPIVNVPFMIFLFLHKSSKGR